MFTCFSQHLVGWFGDRGPRSDFLIATMDLDEPGGFQVFVIRLLKTLNQEFCEFSSTSWRAKLVPLWSTPQARSYGLLLSDHLIFPRAIPFNRRLTSALSDAPLCYGWWHFIPLAFAPTRC